MREQDEELGVSGTFSTPGTATPIPNDVEQSSEIKPTVLEVEESRPPSNTTPSNLETDKPRNSKQLHEIESLDSDNQADTDDDNVEKDPKLQKEVDEDSGVELERELDKLFLGTKKDRPPPSNDTKPKIGAAKAKRQKKAEKQAALEADGKSSPKPHKNRKPYDPSAAIQKARGETVATGRRPTKKK